MAPVVRLSNILRDFSYHDGKRLPKSHVHWTKHCNAAYSQLAEYNDKPRNIRLQAGARFKRSLSNSNFFPQTGLSSAVAARCAGIIAAARRLRCFPCSIWVLNLQFGFHNVSRDWRKVATIPILVRSLPAKGGHPPGNVRFHQPFAWAAHRWNCAKRLPFRLLFT